MFLKTFKIFKKENNGGRDLSDVFIRVPGATRKKKDPPLDPLGEAQPY